MLHQLAATGGIATTLPFANVHCTDEAPGTLPWYSNFDRIRISIDALTPELYKKMRGVDRTPSEVFEWMERIGVEFATLTTINENNAASLDQMLSLLHTARVRNPHYRKAIFLLELGRQLPDWVLQEYQRAGAVAQSIGLETSFGEDILETRQLANSNAARGWRCAVGDISFHMKCKRSLHSRWAITFWRLLCNPHAPCIVPVRVIFTLKKCAEKCVNGNSYTLTAWHTR
jgi:hypothetical protein